jgi:hypothetical protein
MTVSNASGIGLAAARSAAAAMSRSVRPGGPGWSWSSRWSWSSWSSWWPRRDTCVLDTVSDSLEDESGGAPPSLTAKPRVGRFAFSFSSWPPPLAESPTGRTSMQNSDVTYQFQCFPWFSEDSPKNDASGVRGSRDRGGRMITSTKHRMRRVAFCACHINFTCIALIPASLHYQ